MNDKDLGLALTEIAKPPYGSTIVSMIEYRGDIFVATTERIYRLDKEADDVSEALKPLEFETTPEESHEQA